MPTAIISDELVSSSAAGDQTQMACLLEAMTPQVRIMINARLKPTMAQGPLVDDLVQEALLDLSVGLATLERRTVSGLRAFASVIVSRCVADAIRARKRGDGVPCRNGPPRSLDAPINSDHSTARSLGALLSASGASPLTEADQSDLFERVMAALALMKEEHRLVITLAFFDQIDTREIAQQLNLSRPAASMLLIRAVKSLRRNLTGSSQVVALGHELRR